ncbi:Nramp family divalent metal transporter [Pseudarthrobacter enclensis]|uniref:NRAMP (Natural resistance-associated macrophage protein)-like metal ion transporter n=1 Tax=Pseudarthrobacter enclensis TaxID=993070 RepID=A0ABT9RSM2_9MICC|nr:Nramp family divalent metal transporter [Pseudarthrobacter enclensis]MDP9887309.1 NRAMP (natural resistance-associated macrophage protein)-like metal ion transporter [Pseudarthrobacter enclensis]
MTSKAVVPEEVPPPQKSRLRRFGSLLGPGLVTGAADDDPSGIATYAKAGATFSNGMLWTVPVTLPMMMAVQEICDRTALATGESLGRLARRKFSRRPRVVIAVLIVALLVGNILNAAADLMAIGQGMEMLGAGPDHLWSAIAGVGIAVALMSGSFAAIAKVFKWLCVTLLAYVAVLFVANVNWPDVLEGLLGLKFSFAPEYLGLIVAVLGTTISPYLFFWQSAHRVQELRAEEHGGEEAVGLKDRPDAAAAAHTLRKARADVFIGMVFSVLVMFSIMAATAATLGKDGTDVNTAADVAKALQPIVGPAATFLFAAGFIGTGVLGVPVLAASGAAGLAGLLGKDWGLDLSPRRAPLFYALLGVGMVAGVLISFFSTDPIGLLVFSATVNGIAAAPFLVVTMLISRDKAIMGDYKNGRLAATLGWFTAAVMLVAGSIGVWTTLTGA